MSQEVTTQHKLHPGWDAQGCRFQYVVTGRGPWGHIDRAGFGCEIGGDHCLPGSEKCKKRLEQEADRETA